MALRIEHNLVRYHASVYELSRKATSDEENAMMAERNEIRMGLVALDEAAVEKGLHDRRKHWVGRSGKPHREMDTRSAQYGRT